MTRHLATLELPRRGTFPSWKLCALSDFYNIQTIQVFLNYLRSSIILGKFKHQLHAQVIRRWVCWELGDESDCTDSLECWVSVCPMSPKGLGVPKPSDPHPGTVPPLEEPAGLPSYTEPVCTASGGAASHNSQSQFMLSKVTLHFQGQAWQEYRQVRTAWVPR